MRQAHTFAEITSDLTLLNLGGWNDPILVSCTRCGETCPKKKHHIRQAIKVKQVGLFCSKCHVASYRREQTLVEQDGEQGRVCIKCGVWKPLRKFSSGSMSRTCAYCWGQRPNIRFHEYKRRAASPTVQGKLLESASTASTTKKATPWTT